MRADPRRSTSPERITVIGTHNKGLPLRLHGEMARFEFWLFFSSIRVYQMHRCGPHVPPSRIHIVVSKGLVQPVQRSLKRR